MFKMAFLDPSSQKLRRISPILNRRFMFLLLGFRLELKSGKLKGFFGQRYFPDAKEWCIMNHIKVINLRTPADSGQMKPLRFYDDSNQYETHICVVVSQLNLVLQDSTFIWWNWTRIFWLQLEFFIMLKEVIQIIVT